MCCRYNFIIAKIFTAMDSFHQFFIILLACTAITSAANLRCYKGSVDTYDVISLDDPLSLLNSTCYESKRKTVFYVFGYGGTADSSSVKRIVGVYLDVANILLLNWEKEAKNDTVGLRYITTAVPNARKVGMQFGQALINLDAAGLFVSTVHLIGYSLGAQLIATTGRTVNKKIKPLSRITGLDPAGPLFEGPWSRDGLDKSCAKFVDVIHTNPGGLGTVDTVGTVDVWLNCGSPMQPACEEDTYPDLCSHDLSWKYFAEAKKRPAAFVARSAVSCSSWKSGKGSDKVINMGDDIDTQATGSFYLRTKPTSLYGMDEEGSQPVSK